MAVDRGAHRPAPYQRRRPERTVLYRAVAENLETTLALCREEAVAEDPVPAYVERELRQYLRCGILAWGVGYHKLSITFRIRQRESKSLDRIIRCRIRNWKS